MSAPRRERRRVAGLLVAAVAAVLRVDDAVSRPSRRATSTVSSRLRVVDHQDAVDHARGRSRRPCARACARRCRPASRRRRRGRRSSAAPRPRQRRGGRGRAPGGRARSSARERQRAASRRGAREAAGEMERERLAAPDLARRGARQRARREHHDLVDGEPGARRATAARQRPASSSSPARRPLLAPLDEEQQPLGRVALAAVGDRRDAAAPHALERRRPRCSTSSGAWFLPRTISTSLARPARKSSPSSRKPRSPVSSQPPSSTRAVASGCPR